MLVPSPPYARQSSRYGRPPTPRDRRCMADILTPTGAPRINRLASTGGAGSQPNVSLGWRESMTEAFDYAPTAAAPPVEVMLAGGGDARVARDPATGRNQYGCAFSPEEGVADFASSTASTISPRGYAAAAALRERLAASAGGGAAYARELGRLRNDL